VTTPIKIALEDAQAKLAVAPKSFVELLTNDDTIVELFAPRGGRDVQIPHAQDEIYIIASGGGTFRRGGETVTFATGDVLFVPAHMDHRFETFSDDFQTWVIFFGPKK
jgi:mannose-6-phosphate isomerase-like protein (cupin superfamily)